MTNWRRRFRVGHVGIDVRPGIKSIIRPRPQVVIRKPEPNRFGIAFAWVFGGAIAIVVAAILFYYWGVAETNRLEHERERKFREYFGGRR